MAIASIPIVADDIDEPTEQFSLTLYIDGNGYGIGLQGGNITKATAFITQPTVEGIQKALYQYSLKVNTVHSYCIAKIYFFHFVNYTIFIPHIV